MNHQSQKSDSLYFEAGPLYADILLEKGFPDSVREETDSGQDKTDCPTSLLDAFAKSDLPTPIKIGISETLSKNGKITLKEIVTLEVGRKRAEKFATAAAAVEVTGYT
jgi:hypothetical protein